MAKSTLVSLPESEKELWQWLQEKVRLRELSPSEIWRSKLKELKKQDDIKNNANAVILQERLNDAKKIIGEFHDFMEKRGLSEEWFKFKENTTQKEILVKKGIETIELKGKKENGEIKPNS